MARGPPSSSRLRPASLSHVALRTNNLAAMGKWYHEMLAAEIVHQDENTCFLKCDDDFLRVALFKIPNTAAKAVQTNGLEHFAFSFNSVGELVEAYKEKKGLGLLPFRAVHHGPTVSMYYHDPDGNKVEFQYEVITTVEAFEAYMATGAFDENPVGAELEPDEIVRMYESGASFEKRPEVGKRDLSHIK